MMLEWLLIIGMMLVTFLPRYLPLALVNYFKLPPVVMRALPYIPLSVLSVIVVQNSFFIDGQLLFTVENNRLLTVIVAALVAFYTQKLSLTVLVGFIVFIFLQYIV